MNTKDSKKERKLFQIWYEKRQTFYEACTMINKQIIKYKNYLLYKSQIEK